MCLKIEQVKSQPDTQGIPVPEVPQFHVEEQNRGGCVFVRL